MCGENYTTHTVKDCPKLAKNTQMDEDESSDGESVKVLEVIQKPKPAQVQTLMDIHGELKDLQEKLLNSSKLENLLLELSCGQNPNYFETIRKIDVNYKAVNQLEYKLQDVLDELKDFSLDPTDQDIKEYSEKTRELKNSSNIFLLQNFENSFSTHEVKLAEEDRNFISFPSRARVYIRVCILEIHQVQKVLITKDEQLPYKLKFRDMKVYDVLLGNETMVEVIVREEIDLMFSDLINKLRAKVPINKEPSILD